MVAFIVMAVTFEVEVCCVLRVSVRRDMLWSRCVGSVRPAGTLYTIRLFPCCVSMEVCRSCSWSISLCRAVSCDARDLSVFSTDISMAAACFFLGHLSCPGRNSLMKTEYSSLSTLFPPFSLVLDFPKRIRNTTPVHFSSCLFGYETRGIYLRMPLLWLIVWITCNHVWKSLDSLRGNYHD